MKKIACFLAVILILLNMVSCGGTDSKLIGTQDICYPVSDSFLPVVSTDPTAPSTRKLVIGENTYGLQYHDTWTYRIGDITADRYFFGQTEEEGYVLYRKDRSVYTIFGKREIVKLDIAPSASQSAVLAELKDAMAPLFDPDDYTYVEVRQDSPACGNFFGRYLFRFYNMSQCYITETATVSVRDDGCVDELTVCRAGDHAKAPPPYVDLQRAKFVLDAGAENAGNSAGRKYISYALRSRPAFYVYRREWYVLYDIDLTVEDERYSGPITIAETLLIPARVIR